MELLKGVDLERAKPEELGISTKGIKGFIDEINEKGINMHAFTIIKHGKIASQCFWKPYSAEHPHILYSVSKSFTSTAIGIARGEGLLDLDDRVCDYFPEYKEAINSNKRNKELTIRSLLTMNSGKHCSIFNPRNHTDWIEDYFKAPFTEKPNTLYSYVSENTFMCSAIIKKVTGKSCLDYLNEKLFAPLGIEKPFWEHDGKDNSSGGWGLYLKNEDLAKAMLPYLYGGKWIDGTQLIPEDWTKMATTKQVFSYGDGHFYDGKCDNVNGYGFQFWINPDRSTFRCEGLYGQRCMFFPQYDSLVSINCGQSQDYEMMEIFWKYFPDILNNDDNTGDCYEELIKTINSCEVAQTPVTSRRYDIEKKINNAIIKCDPKQNAGFLPIMMNCIVYNKPEGYSSFKLNFKDDFVNLTFEEGGYSHSIDCSFTNDFAVSKLKLCDFNFTVYSKAYWTPNGKLHLSIRPIETCHEIILEFTFNPNNKVIVHTAENPTFEELAVFYLTFTGKPIPTKKLSKGISSVVKTLGVPMFDPDFNGTLVCDSEGEVDKQ